MVSFGFLQDSWNSVSFYWYIYVHVMMMAFQKQLGSISSSPPHAALFYGWTGDGQPVTCGWSASYLGMVSRLLGDGHGLSSVLPP